MELSERPASVHLWLTDPRCLNESRRQAYLALLDNAERARYERIRHEETRDHHLLTRALVRSTLSHYDPRPASEWRFIENEHGCPFIAPEHASDGLHFNVSHTQGLIVCALTRGRALGVDVEFEPRKSRTSKIADRFFAPSEVAALRRLPEGAQRQRFFTYWTLKEAYIKARGMGLAIPLKDFWFDVDTPGQIHFDNANVLGDDPKGWWFARYYASPDHPLALALSGEATQDVAMRAFRVAPLEAPQSIVLKRIACTD